MLSDNTQKSKHLLLTSTSYFPQELVFSLKVRPRSHLDNCIFIFCLLKGPHTLLSTVKSQQLLNSLLPLVVVAGATSELGDSVHTVPRS